MTTPLASWEKKTLDSGVKHGTHACGVIETLKLPHPLAPNPFFDRRLYRFHTAAGKKTRLENQTGYPKFRNNLINLLNRSQSKAVINAVEEGIDPFVIHLHTDCESGIYPVPGISGFIIVERP